MRNRYEDVIWTITGILKKNGIQIHLCGPADLIRIDYTGTESLLAYQLISVGSHHLTCTSLLRKSCPLNRIRCMAELVCRINNCLFRNGWLRLSCQTGALIYEQAYVYRKDKISKKLMKKILKDGQAFFVDYDQPITTVIAGQSDPEEALEAHPECAAMHDSHPFYRYITGFLPED